MGNYLLAIDDEPELLAIVGRIAEWSAYTANITTDAETFKSCVRSGIPDVIMIDLQMPNCDGVELLEFLAEENCRANIILCSGFDPRVVNITKEFGEKLGLKMCAPLAKPVRAAELRLVLDLCRNSRFQIDVHTLHEAIDGDQIKLFFQPLIDLRDRRLIGWEGLARWQHPQQGLIMPDRFIKIAEREGLIDTISERVAQEAVRQIADWRRMELETFVSINLSAKNLTDSQLPDRLAQLCAHHHVPPALLRLELTETAAMSDPIHMIGVLTRLRLKGFELAIDDFGTGYSSLLQLHRLPFSELKIDQSFISKMHESAEAALIVGLSINLAHGLKMQVIAEGVENAQVAEKLAADGCEIGQGYYFGKPMPASETQGWVRKNFDPPKVA